MSAASVIAEMQAEAHEWGRRRGLAQIMSSTAASKIPSRNNPSHYAKALAKDDVEHLVQDRDPCFECGTRKDRHDEFGCKRWRAW